MEYWTSDVIDYKKLNQINSLAKRSFKNRESIQNAQKYNLRHSKIINFILIEITLIILSKTNRAFDCPIEIRVNKIGNNQIISDKYKGNLPKIYINEIFIGQNVRKININEINSKICLKWDEHPSSDFSYLFDNLESISYFYIDYSIFRANYNINITRMFYNCKNIATIIFDISGNKKVNISAGQEYTYYYPIGLSHAFYNCISLTNLQLKYFKTENVQEISYMFYNCKNLERIPIINSYFSNKLITNMRGMFQNCKSLNSLNLSTFYTPNVEIMWDMFKNCKSLRTLNLSNFDTSKVTDMESMFEGCERLISLSLVNFKTSNVHYMNKMFLGCKSLQSLYFNNIVSDALGTIDQMFCNCSSLKYLNIYSLTEKAQSISEMFERTSNDFVFCIKEYENIPNIFKELYKKSYTRPDCSNACYGNEKNRPYNSYKKICCPKFLYEDTCYDKCPPKTKSNGDKICYLLNCPNKNLFYNYEQNGCITSIPNGFYEYDTTLKTIDKCHEKCKTCKRGPTETKEYCSSCKTDSPYLYLDNCLKSCPNISYTDSFGIIKCKCVIEECLDCTDESLKEGSCLTCNEGYYPKIDDNSKYTKCYKEPPKYYFDKKKQIFKPCYPSCERCYGDGNNFFHNCLKCDSNHTFTLKNLDKNCYENCSYYYYFDNNNKYKCTEKEKCPNDFKFLIVELRQCVRACNDTEYKKMLNYGCYKECPLNISVQRKENPNSCKPICTYEFPFELVEENKCVASCSIMQRSKKLCITNYFGNRTNLEIQELILVDKQKDLEYKFNYTIINENQTVFIEENQTNYEIVTTRNKNPNTNTTRINLGECEDILKENYGIPQDNYLYILVIDAYVEGKTGPVALYEVYYPLFDSKILYKLDLSFCKGIRINVLYNIELDEPELYNKNNIIYNDMCRPYSSKEGVDMVVNDLRSEYKDNNKSICEEGCEYSGYIDGYVDCNCDIKNTAPKMTKVKIDKNKLYKFVNIKNIANFGVLKCTNLFLVKERMITNLGIYSFIPTFIAYFICLILFYKKDFQNIKEDIKDLLFAINNLKYLNDAQKNKKNQKKMQLNILEPIIVSLVKAKNIIKDEIEEDNNNKNQSIIRNDSSIQLNTDFIIEEKKTGEFISKGTDKKLKRITQILSFNEKELNDLKFIKALKFDKRSFIQTYYSFLKMDHILFKIFNSKDYNSLIIKIYLCFYNFNLTYVVNALFFNEGTMHQILEDEGKFNFLFQFPQIIYSSIISYFFGMVLEYFALSEDDILGFKAEKVMKMALKKTKKLLITLEIKFTHFFILSFVFLLLFWYYIICFCVVYKNTQYHLIKDTIIGFGTGLLTPIGTKLLPVLFRLIGLKKKKKYLFLASKILQIFL